MWFKNQKKTYGVLGFLNDVDDVDDVGVEAIWWLLFLLRRRANCRESAARAAWKERDLDKVSLFTLKNFYQKVNKICCFQLFFCEFTLFRHIRKYKSVGCKRRLWRKDYFSNIINLINKIKINKPHIHLIEWLVHALLPWSHRHGHWRTGGNGSRGWNETTLIVSLDNYIERSIQK